MFCPVFVLFSVFTCIGIAALTNNIRTSNKIVRLPTKKLRLVSNKTCKFDLAEIFDKIKLGQLDFI